jgi:uncharacterized protein (DUF1778 family)
MKTETLQIRVSPEQKKQVQEMAAKKSMSVSEYILSLATEAWYKEKFSR